MEAFWASLVAQMVKNLSIMRKTWVQSLGWEDLLEKGMATHYSMLTWRIPWTEEPGELQFMGLQRVRHDRVTNTFTDKPVNKRFWLIECQITTIYPDPITYLKR